MALHHLNTDWGMHAFPLERALSSALGQVSEAIAIVAAKDGAIIYSNAAFSRHFESPGHRAPTQKFVDLFAGNEEERIIALALEQALSGMAWTGLSFTRTSSGRGIKFEIALSPVCNGEGAVEALVVRMRDITLEDRTDGDLRLSQKMSALGTLAGGVAHDFNNLIGAILGAAECIEMDLDPNSRLHRKLEIIKQAGGRAKGLTAQILNFSRHRNGAWTLIDFTGLVTEVSGLLQAAIPGNISVRSHLAKGIRILGDPSQLHQVIMNLGINASQAMQPAGGTLSIQLQPVPTDKRLGDPAFQEPCVQLIVEDTGCGMDQPTLDRIFEPFFTTKGAGEGTGLGLSLVYNIIQGHGGNLQVSSRPGRGSCFKVYLPVNYDRRKGVPKKVTELQFGGAS